MDRHEVIGGEVEKLLEYVETDTTHSADETFEVPARNYTDPDRFQQEMDHIFLKTPLLGALSVEIPNAGDYKSVELMGKPVLITRRSDGTADAMMNVCSHRGMTLKPVGLGNAKRIICPYHAWSFANDGKLLAVADSQKFGSVCKADRGLTKLPCVEAAGIVWICLTPGIEIDIKKHLGGMLADLENFELDKWHYCGTRQIYGPNWKIAYDGYLEGYHFAAAHPETIHPRTMSNVMHFKPFGPHMRVGFPQVGIKDKLADLPKENWGKNENTGFDYVRTLFPNVSIFFAEELTQVAQLVPGPAPGQNSTNLIFIRRDPPKDQADTDGLTQMMDWLTDVVEREDYGVGLEVQKGLESGAIDSVLFGKNERGNHYFHRYVQYCISDDPDAKPPTL